MDDELEALLELLRAAPDDRADDYADRVAARQGEAIAAVRPWLTSAETASRAVKVIEATAKHGVTKGRVCAELARIKDTKEYEPAKSSARAAGARLRCPQKTSISSPLDNPWRKPGNRTYMRAKNQEKWHVVDGTTVTDGEVTRYITVCHRWDSRGYVSEASDGGIRRDAPATELLCKLCRDVETGGYASPHSRWRAGPGETADGTRVTHMGHDGSRHVAIEPAPLATPELGVVYLTKCGRVVERGRVHVVTSRPLPPALDPCENCE